MGSNGWVRTLFKYLLWCCIGIIFGSIISHYLIFRVEISGVSMEPTYVNGQKLWVLARNHISAGNIPLLRGDVVVVERPMQDGELLYQGYVIKRVVGVPGDTVEIKDGKVYINGEPLKEDYISVETEGRDLGYDKVTLDDRHYYVLGDNRSVSYDSRSFGGVVESQILGKVLVQ